MSTYGGGHEPSAGAPYVGSGALLPPPAIAVSQAQERRLAACTAIGVDPCIGANAHGPSAGLPYVDFSGGVFCSSARLPAPKIAVGQARGRRLAALTAAGVDPSIGANAHEPSAGLPYVDFSGGVFCSSACLPAPKIAVRQARGCRLAASTFWLKLQSQTSPGGRFSSLAR